MIKKNKYISKDFKLLKSFVQSEFFFQQKKFDKRYHFNFLKKKYSFRKEALVINDPISNLKHIKQFVRLIQFVNVSTRPALFMLLNNEQYFDLLVYFWETKLNNSACFYAALNDTLSRDLNFSKMVITLNCFLNFQSDFFYKSANNYNILYKINPVKEFSSFQNFKLNSDVDSLKKFIYLLVVLKQALNE